MVEFKKRRNWREREREIRDERYRCGRNCDAFLVPISPPFSRVLVLSSACSLGNDVVNLFDEISWKSLIQYDG